MAVIRVRARGDIQDVPERRSSLRSGSGISCSGFTYLGILFGVALMGALLASIAIVWHQAEQREKERQLLFVGKQFRQAIASYYEKSPGLAKQFPKSLDNLLQDKRFPFTMRHLRRIYYDPITGGTDWGLVRDAAGGITGVYSKSADEPVKKANFGSQYVQFENKEHYSDWQFVYAQGLVAVAQPVGAPAPPPAEIVPPQYVAPPPQLPKAGSPDDQRKHLCDVMHSNDLTICLNMKNKFGDGAGEICLASAGTRYATCLDGGSLPPLAVQYK
jgi:type II secretory pathway pseudopilin PulG